LAQALPVADAGANQIVILPTATATLDGTASQGTSLGALQYAWTQVYGPSVLQWTGAQTAQPSVAGLQSGVYLVRLDVTDGSASDFDEVFVISSSSANLAPTVSIVSPRAGDAFLEYDPIQPTAMASDLNDSVVRVEWYANGQAVGTAQQAPWSVTWTPPAGTYNLVAIAFDGLGDSSVSAPRQVVVDPAPPCEGTSWNGDFSYRFSPDDNNPTLTFIPSGPGVGVPTCILYYGTDPGSMPGYPVTPNVPFTLNATKGTTIYFYYTYSFPGAVEKNNSAHKDSYVVGSCVNIGLNESDRQGLRLVPNPASDWVVVEGLDGPSELQVIAASGHIVRQVAANEARVALSLAGLAEGVYVVQCRDRQGTRYGRVVKISR
jgi:hypothetical protein